MNTVIQAASVTENKELRVKVLHQTDQIVQDFAQLLSNVHDRLVKGKAVSRPDRILETLMRGRTTSKF